MAGAIGLGMLAGGTIPTQIKSPFGSDWRDLYSARGDPTTPAYYVEPGPQDLSVPDGTGYAGTFAMTDNRPSWVRRSVEAPNRTTPWEAAWQAPEPAPEFEPAMPRPIDQPAEPTPAVMIEAPAVSQPDSQPAAAVGASAVGATAVGMADAPQGSAPTITL